MERFAMRKPRGRVRWLVMVAAVTLVSTTSSPAAGPASAAVSRKVLWIVMENHSYSQIIGATLVAPYINGTLRSRGGSASNMHSETHPSLPNYIAMTTGSTHGIADDNSPPVHQISGPSIFSQTDPSWRSYEDVMPSSCDHTG